MKRIGILASYNGSGFQTIKKACDEGILNAQVNVVVSNNTNANALKRAEQMQIPNFIINAKKYPNEDLDEKIAELFKEFNCDYIFCSGYMKIIGSKLISSFEEKIINTHPALLPSKYGGKGMYGRFVHEAIIKNNEKKSGVTIHFVNEKYDDGRIILKKELELLDDETVDSLESRIKDLESLAIVEAFEKLLA
ncbi:phosphoribosylglycinamide formyltransferase [Poseidonibacter lekithochrous]|uniref:phosphoribosylglycinamide formyltransferase n=1 Tax=Poseidonibacter TaxID=2321187 RepID=UPI001C0A072D|nr:MULTISPECIES: phosphoribosylglycinamide formyltransferase [Poseidonibacter]MBU3015226.1 phosphoribosylglycinamide formyltransferase [Poseidonibacter lekithochrous]MDO6828524.1 phosphoribosylglycinamide formyltransferase [Poseidonibacter sp. 1_MG-2023]